MSADPIDWAETLGPERERLIDKYTASLRPRTDEERTLLADLVTRTLFSRGTRPALADQRFSCYEEFVLEYGRFYHHADVPEGFEYGELRHCYSNAFETANEHATVVYVEGFGLSLMSVQHAWVADAFETDDPSAIDVTWRFEDDRPRAYLGVAFDTQFARTLIVKQGVYGLLGGDWKQTQTMLDLGLDQAVDGEYGFEPVYCAYGDGSLPEITDDDLQRLREQDELDELEL